MTKFFGLKRTNNNTDIGIASPNKEILILYNAFQHFSDSAICILQTVGINQHVECDALKVFLVMKYKGENARKEGR